MPNLAKRLVKTYAPSPLLRQITNMKNKTSHSHPQFTSPIDKTENTLHCAVAYANSGGFCVPMSASRRPAVQRIFEGKAYEPETIKFLSTHCLDQDIVHAGTFFGDFLPLLSQSRPHRIVWAFEPNSENFRCAQMTCIINGLTNVELRNVGLGESQCQVKMEDKNSEGNSLGGASTIISAHSEKWPEHTTSVNIDALDNVLPSDRHIGIIQLDVEGYEKNALNCAMSIIKYHLPIIVLETVADADWMEENIYALGYKIGGKLHSNTIFWPDPK